MRFVLLLALVGAAMALPKRNMRIVGGEATTIERYPYMSSMMYNLWGIWSMQYCGGSLITTTSVLSAAHCYVGTTANSWEVRLGSTLASSGGSLHPASALITHPQYNDNTLNFDVAIVRLRVPAVISATVGTVSIAGPNYHLTDGTQVVTAGWGTLWSNGPASEILQHVFVDVINQELCVARYAYLKTLPGYQNWPDVTPEMICVGIQDVGGKDACQGDSGGPLSYPADNGHVLVGIVSWGFGCGHDFYPGVNARVSRFTDWILSNA